MTALATLLALAVSLAALAYLAATDPKRRRSFDLPPVDRPRRPGIALAVMLLPGPVLALLGTVSGLVVWLGAVTVSGWAVAALRPGWLHRARQGRAGRWLAWVGEGSARASLSAARQRCRAAVAMPGRVDRLERQVAELRTEVALLRQPDLRQRAVPAGPGMAVGAAPADRLPDTRIADTGS